MLQRKQSLFLLLAFIAIVVCLAMPIGRFIATGDGSDFILYNGQIIASSDTSIWYPMYLYAPLAILLLIACPLTLWTIFKYKSRKLQAALCSSLVFIMVLWIAYYAFLGFYRGIEGTTFYPAFAAALPVVAVVLFVMARKGIIHDENLVRSADRIR